VQSFYPERFERDMGTTEAEWLMRLPLAIGAQPWQPGERSAQVAFNGGQLLLAWQVLPPRAIALLRMPRLQVRFVFEGVDAATRLQFMQRFDLTMQRGGG
jgi:hypothetical protein